VILQSKIVSKGQLNQPAVVLAPTSKLLDRIAIRLLLCKNLIEQFLRLKITCNLLIYGNAQETKRVHTKIINTLEVYKENQALGEYSFFFINSKTCCLALNTP